MRPRSQLRFLAEGVEGVVVLGFVLCTWPLSKRWLRHWGTCRDERERAWPGDRLVSTNGDVQTRAIDIDAPDDDVWPWVVQFGLGRAGFYSYELLERIVGIPVTNVESVESTLQNLDVGDEILLHPKEPGIQVAHLETGRHVCFGGVKSSDPARSWSIYIEPTSPKSCRLLVRACVEPLRRPTWLARLAGVFEQPIDFVMEQRMLRTIKRLAERSTD